MIGVILGILKVIGILLLVILGLLLFICVCALFVPVRYRGEVSKQPGEVLKAQGEISWLLHLLHISVEKQETGAAVTIRIFGISPEMVRNFRKKRQKKKNAKKRRQAAKKKKTETKQIDKKRVDTVGKETAQKKTSVQKTEQTLQDTSTVKRLSSDSVEKNTTAKEKVSVRSGDVNESEKGRNGSSQEPEKMSVTQKKRSFLKKITGIYKKTVSLPKRMLQAIRQFVKKVTDIRQSVSALRAFINRQEVRAAVSLVWKKALRLLKGVCPHKLEGQLTYGCSDPADTGMVLAVLGALYPVYGSSVSVTPDFQQKTFEASLKGRGRIYGILILVTGLQLYFDKNIQFIIKNRKKEA